MDSESKEAEIKSLLLKQSIWKNMLDIVLETLTQKRQDQGRQAIMLSKYKKYYRKH